MRSIVFIPMSLAAALTVSVVPTRAEACGFKAGGAIGAVRFDQLNHTQNPVNIVMYANPDSEDAEKTLSPKLEVVLAKIGHAVKRVETKDELQKVLSTGKWDCETHGYHDVQVVLADLPDAEQLGSRGPTIVPIVSKPAEFDKTKREKYPVVLTPSARPSSHVPAIENVARSVVKKSGPVMLAQEGRAKEDRTLVAARTGNEAVATKQDRELISAGGNEGGQVNRGGPVAAGRGENEAAPAPAPAPAPVAARTEPAPAKNEPAPAPVAAKSEPAPAPIAAKTEPAPKPAPVKTEAIAAKIEPVEKAEPAPAAKVEPPKKAGPNAPNREELYFAPGSARLGGNFARLLDRQAKWMEANPTATITVEGHADRTGPADANQALSERRAEFAKSYLVSKGVAESRVKAVGYGEEKPVDPPGDSFRNRCVVILHDEE